MKTIVFASSFSNCRAGKCINLLNQDSPKDLNKNIDIIKLSPVFKQFGQTWFEQFTVWLAQLNCNHAGLFWWAHIATAKNVLSSLLGQYYFQVQVVCEIAKQDDVSVLNVLGATPGQMASIASLLPATDFQLKGRAWQLRHWHRIVNCVQAFSKQCLRVVTVLQGFFMYRCPKKQVGAIDLCLFTYVDGVRRVGVDNYFGQLPELLRKDNQFFSAVYLGLVDKPYRKRLKQIVLEDSHAVPYLALYGLLGFRDYVWALLKTCHSSKIIDSSDNEPIAILREVFVHELGGYFHNLLIYKAMGRFIKRHTPKVLVYPFENKSLEKMILLAAKNSGHSVKMVGYQHTSVTPKHASTLLFRAGEAACTPLPDKIITVGQITKDYLEAHGNYPSGIFVAGGALRQKRGERLPRQTSKTIRVLLALSSSQDELIQSVEFFKKVMQHVPELELGIRPHIMFPLSILPKALLQWINEHDHVFNLSNTLLEDNLHWCSLTAYVSSTVSLESLMRGKPVVNFSITDVISSDPLMGEVPFHWVVDDDLEMIKILRQVHTMSEHDYEAASLRAISYVHHYLSPMNDLVLKNFSDTLA